MREKKHPGGRPSFGVTEATYLIRAPLDLIEAMKRVAEVEGITASEAWRRAARKWLGRPEHDEFSEHTAELKREKMDLIMKRERDDE